MAHRYFTTEITENQAILTGEEAAHLSRVLRAKVGQAILVCDGAGTEYETQVAGLFADRVECKILASRPSQSEPDIRVVCCLGYSKGDKLEWAIQKAVELGAAEIVPFFSENCVVKPKKEEEKCRRYNRIAFEAAKQSGRGRIPIVRQAVAYKEMLEIAAATGKAFFLYEGGGQPLSQQVENLQACALITGAEGGFTPAEADLAHQAGCIAIGLGPRILRCETAPVAALAALMAFTGNLE